MERRTSNIIDLVKNEHFVQWIISPSEESTHYWSAWIAKNPERKQDVEIAKQLICSVEYNIDESLPEHDYDLLLENIVNYSHSKENNYNYSTNISWKFIGIAASIVLLLTLSFTLYLNNSIWGDSKVVQTETVIKTTQAGQKLTVKLPDNSKVVLNSESKLTYTKPFKSNRNLSLVGEAFFEVTKDNKHPFTIQTGNVTTKVVGTSFNVRSYPEDTQKSIAVITGKVEVTDNQGNQAYLIPNKRGVFNLEEHQLLVEPFSEDVEIGWKDGLLTFKNTPVSEVFNRLERWYGVKFEVDPHKTVDPDWRFDGKFQNKSLEYILKTFGYPDLFEYKIKDNKVIIY